jgi:hypothetical protein
MTWIRDFGLSAAMLVTASVAVISADEIVFFVAQFG